MLWSVEGADKNTGEERVIFVEAMTEAGAAEAASNEGVLASKIFPGGGSTISQPPIMPQPVAYASSSGRYRATPDYKMVRVGSTVMRILGIVLFVIAGLCIVGGILIALFASNGPIDESLFIMAASAAYGLIFSIWGFLCLFGGAVAVAIRDSARNSFNR